MTKNKEPTALGYHAKIGGKYDFNRIYGGNEIRAAEKRDYHTPLDIRAQLVEALFEIPSQRDDSFISCTAAIFKLKSIPNLSDIGLPYIIARESNDPEDLPIGHLEELGDEAGEILKAVRDEDFSRVVDRLESYLELRDQYGENEENVNLWKGIPESFFLGLPKVNQKMFEQFESVSPENIYTYNEEVGLRRLFWVDYPADYRDIIQDGFRNRYILENWNDLRISPDNIIIGSDTLEGVLDLGIDIVGNSID